MVVILFLECFILFSIFDGLSDHTGQLTTPEQYIPPLCREIVVSGDWNKTNSLDNLASVVARHHESYTRPEDSDENKPQHALCIPVTRAYKAIRDDERLSQNLIDTRKISREMRELRAELDRMKGAYDTSLLEGIAGQGRGGENADSIRKEVTEKTAALNVLAGKHTLIEGTLREDRRIQEMLGLAVGVSGAGRKTLRDELRTLNFWYPVKRLGMEMLFLVPLLAVFYFWNSRSIAARRPFQTLISSHLLVVVTIPVFFKVLELIYDIIHRKLLKQVIDLLKSLKLVALWNYLLIGVAILIALALIYLFQKKLFSREKLMRRRMAKGLCHHCGQHLATGSRHCHVCGTGQYRHCSHCHEPTPVQGKYCTACGLGGK